MISLRCTLLDVAEPLAATDLEVRAPVGSTLRQVAAELLAGAARDQRSSLTVGGRLLPPDAVLGQRPLVDGALITATAQPDGLVAQAESLLMLHVVAGPDAGHGLMLRPGTFTVGRGAAADLVVDDPDLSRQHFSVTVRPDGVQVQDIESTNGTVLEGAARDVQAMTLRPGQRLRAGSSAFVVRSWSATAAVARPNGLGQIDVQRSSRARQSVTAVDVSWPASPAQAPAHQVPWIAALLPLLLCVPLAWWMHQPSYLLFGLMSPLMMLGSTVADRLQRRRRNRADRTDRQSRLADARRRLTAARSAEVAALRDAAGDPAELVSTARGPGARLWERGLADPDLLEVFVGSGRRRASRTVVSGNAPDEADIDCDGNLWLDDAPISVRLDDAGHLALVGDPGRRRACARYVVAQLAVRVSPRLLRVVVMADADWSWARWLPHASHLSALDLDRMVRSREATDRQPPFAVDRPALEVPTPRIVVVIDGSSRQPDDPLLAAVLRVGPRVGVHVLWLDVDDRSLPAQCEMVLDVAQHGGSSLRRPDGSALAVAADGTSREWAQVVARALAPLRDAMTDGLRMPRDVGLSALLATDLGPEATTAPATVQRWGTQPRSTRFVVGQGVDGPLALDLALDGPHALVAGTTGAGKSELLTTLVASLAIVNRPDELCFVLIDYKGGAAFRQCTALPHVVGLVTDLDDHLAGRALTSLQAELTRRERLLAGASATDLAGYQQAREVDPGLPPLARLVIVVDEFRLLATELPDFLEGVIRLAAVGRSLGVHLVLATQRPGGIVSPDIKANVNLRICLRVRDRVDSDDVIDAPDAAALPLDVPGRALARAGSSSLRPFQVALAGGVPGADEAAGITVRRLDAQSAPAAFAGSPPPAPPGRRERQHDELTDLAKALRQASLEVGAVAPPSPWLPPLPDRVEWSQRGGPPGALTLGLVDLPDRGQQRPFQWDPDGGSHLAISGTSRTGRTSALLTVALAVTAASATGALDAELHVIDAAGGRLAALLGGLPSVGTVLTAEQPRLVARLVTRLSDALISSGSADQARAILLIDGWDRLAQALEQVDHGAPLDALLALVRDGESAGLRLVVAGGRAVLLSRIAHLVGERLLLRAADAGDLLLAGVAAPLSHWPAGRVLHAPSGREVQLAWPGDDGRLGSRLAELAGRLPRRATPLRVRELPSRIGLDEAMASVTNGAVKSGAVHGASAAVLIGVGGDDARPVHLELGAPLLAAVAGPPGSGRTTVLRSICHQLGPRALPVVLAGTEAVADWPGATHDAADAAGLARAAARTPGRVVLVDDVDLLQHSEIEATILDLARSTSVVVGTTIDHLTSSYSGVAAAVRRHRTGVLLQPTSAADGAPFGLRAEPPDVVLAGRGLLITRGAPVAVQVADRRAPPRR